MAVDAQVVNEIIQSADSLQPPGVMAGNGADAEPWQHLLSSTLKKNTVVLPSQAQVSVGAHIKLLGEQGITGIISMQTTSRGQFRHTVESYEKAKLLVLNGFDCKGERVSPHFVSAPTTQLHIHDAPIWISDGVLKAGSFTVWKANR